MKEKKGEIRIISGKWKGKKILFNLSSDLRPTPDRAKETLFNWLGQDLKNLDCLDLFSGTGALGLEALSRGAKKITFVEKKKNYLQEIKKIISDMGEIKKCDFFLEDCVKWIESFQLEESYDLVFIDPPFKKNLICKLLENLIQKKILVDRGRIYFEYEKVLELKLPGTVKILKEKNLGKKSYVLAEITYPSS